VIGPHAHPTGVGAQVIDPIGNRLTDLGIGKVVHAHPLGLPAGCHSAPAVGKTADQLLLLGSHADHRLARLLVHIAKLPVPIRMLGTLLGLEGALQASTV
jgi:hypothetical protein